MKSLPFCIRVSALGVALLYSLSCMANSNNSNTNNSDTTTSSSHTVTSILPQNKIVPSIEHLDNVQTHQSENDITLTLDACGGKTDWNILHFLVDNHIPATIFVTEKWIDGNAQAVSYLKEHKDIFQIENHGKEHREAVYRPVGAYHLPATENDQGMQTEVQGGEDAIEKNFGIKAQWYRDAGALYDSSSINWLNEHHWHIAGYSVAGDEGATASTSRILHLLSQVKPGDVILMHMNKPQGHTYEGMKTGILALKDKGMHFTWLDKSAS
jgi:peptidoglycan/xylan/chitin deacetylase (PgdA/CDA1 family)